LKVSSLDPAKQRIPRPNKLQAYQSQNHSIFKPQIYSKRVACQVMILKISVFSHFFSVLIKNRLWAFRYKLKRPNFLMGLDFWESGPMYNDCCLGIWNTKKVGRICAISLHFCYSY
jgi:hypothetical protein